MKNKHLFKIAACLIGIFLALSGSWDLAAQTSRVSGRVTGEDGAPLPGVFVSVPGTKATAVTDDSGNYSLAVPASAESLSFSLLGMEELTVSIAGRGKIDVILKEDTLYIENAVAIGYGSAIRKELTSSISSVGGEEMTQRASAMNMLENMAGKIAGVNIQSGSGRPGGKMTARIRGTGSINASSDPIYILDGVVDVDPSLINSADIESISVLKDAAATAMYGAKGANGVIIITTKSGKKGEGTVTFDTSTGISVLTRRYDTLNSEEYISLLNSVYAYSGIVPPYYETPDEMYFNYQKDAAGEYIRDENGYLIGTPKYDVDWMDEVTRIGIVSNNNVSFSTANDKTSIYASIGYQDNQGIVINTDAQRLTGTINLKTKVNEWLDIQAIATGSHSRSNNSDQDGSIGSNATSRAMHDYPPIIPNEHNNQTYQAPGGTNFQTPWYIATSYVDYMRRNNLGLSLTNNIHLTKDLVLTVKGDYQREDYTRNQSAPADYQNMTAFTPFGYDDNNQTTKWSNEDYLTYNKSFLASRLKTNFTLGASFYKYHNEWSDNGAEKLSSGSYQWYNMSAGVTANQYHKIGSGLTETSMSSMYFRTNLGWESKYLLSATLRRDGASNFGENSKWGTFYSLAAGWVVSEEKFWEPVKEAINHFKVRLSYGTVGNATIPAYRTYAQYGTYKTLFNGAEESAVKLNNLGNRDLSWETAGQFDAGVDLAFFNDRVQVMADWYRKRNYNLLYERYVPYTTGYSSTWDNIGELMNTGFELTINSHNIDRRNFKWDTDFIFSTFKTVAVNLNGDIIDNGGLRSVEGQEWEQFYALERIGTWGLDEVEAAAVYDARPGDAKYHDLQPDGIIDDNDKQFMGTRTPKYELSLSNTFFWNGFSLLVDMNSMLGHKIYMVAAELMDGYYDSNDESGYLNYWTPENQNTYIWTPRLSGEPNPKYGDSYYLRKADFLRIKTISLSYDFKYKLLKKSRFVKGLVFGVTAENPYVWTAYPGNDPEVIGSSWMSTGSGQGQEWYTYPKPLTITGNLKITF
ncbi:MAG: TonB-dependent receptor [Bacteroidales bacterium]|nr:TonB-dependent receptor [Bacteroidales bacterium]